MLTTTTRTRARGRGGRDAEVGAAGGQFGEEEEGGEEEGGGDEGGGDDGGLVHFVVYGFRFLWFFWLFFVVCFGFCFCFLFWVRGVCMWVRERVGCLIGWVLLI